MKDEACKVMPPGFETKEPVINCMGKHGKRVPVTYDERGKRPFYKRRVKRTYVQILQDIKRVIPIDKIVFKRREKNKKGNDRYKKTRYNYALL